MVTLVDSVTTPRRQCTVNGMKHMHLMHRMRIFSNRFPLLGPLMYVLSLQFFIAQWVTASLWSSPAYSFGRNVISDLGNTACGQYYDRYVCSPGNVLFNGSIIVLGFTMAAGSLLIYQEFNRTRLSFVAFFLMGLAGVGTMLVGIFPENSIGLLHGLGAFLAIGVGNIALILLALAITQARYIFRVYTFITGVVALTAFVLFVAGIDLGLGNGGIERLAGHPQTLWLILFGLYMTGTRVRARRKS